MMRRLLLFLAAFLVVLVASTEPSLATSNASQSADVQTEINSFLTDLKTGFQDKRVALLPMGQHLANTLIFFVASWLGIKILLEGGATPQLIGRFIPAILSWSIMLTVMNHYGGGGALDLPQATDATMRQIASAVVGGAGDGFGDGLAMLIDSAIKIWDAGPHGWAAVAQLPYVFEAYLYKILTVGLLMMAAVIYAAMYTVGNVMMLVGWIVGPVMIPWIVWEPASFLFMGWIRFMIVAGMYFVVGNAMTTITSGMMNHINTLAAKASALAMGDQFLILSMAATLLAGIIMYLMWQIPQIANGLLSGHAVASIGWKFPSLSSSGTRIQSGGNAGGGSSPPAKRTSS